MKRKGYSVSRIRDEGEEVVGSRLLRACRQGKILGLERKGEALEGMTREHGLSCSKGISLVTLCDM